MLSEIFNDVELDASAITADYKWLYVTYENQKPAVLKAEKSLDQALDSFAFLIYQNAFIGRFQK